MLDVLKNLRFRGNKEELLFFVCDVVGNSGISVHDAEIICGHKAGMYFLSVPDLIMYCNAFGWVKQSNNMLSVSSDVLLNIECKNSLNDFFIKSTVENLFKLGIFNADMFCYDVSRQSYTLKNEMFSLHFSTIRDILTSQGFLVVARDGMRTCFSISPLYESLVAELCKIERQKMSLEQLKKKIESNNIVGEKAELFVLNYEKKRLGYPVCDFVNRISEIDVTAGYDIISFNSPSSKNPDRFIEVKATSAEGFYWSVNEYETAKLLGEKYFIYLVSVNSINDSTYEPEIIINPAEVIMKGTDWAIEPQSYKVFRAHFDE